MEDVATLRVYPTEFSGGDPESIEVRSIRGPARQQGESPRDVLMPLVGWVEAECLRIDRPATRLDPLSKPEDPQPAVEIGTHLLPQPASSAQASLAAAISAARPSDASPPVSWVAWFQPVR